MERKEAFTTGKLLTATLTIQETSSHQTSKFCPVPAALLECNFCEEDQLQKDRTNVATWWNFMLWKEVGVEREQKSPRAIEKGRLGSQSKEN